MAILSKIRERSMFLILVIGLALFAFVLDPSTLGDFFNSTKINEVGDINGESISRQEFAEALDNYQTQNGNRVSEMQASKTVWDNLVREKLYETQLEEAGITIGEQDIMNALYQAPSVQNDIRFQNAGVFDKEKFKEFLATMKNDPAQKQTWSAWQNYIKSIGTNLKKNTYDNLINAGLGASLKEGEAEYLNNNTKVTAQYVYVPYTSIADSLVTLKKSDIKNYMDKNPNDFKVEASRDIQYVKFDIKPTAKDEEAIKNEVAKLLEDREEYSTVTKGSVTVKGLKNAEDYKVFLDENKSDVALDENIKFKSDLFAEVADAIMAKNEGEVYGPYKDRGFYKISKVTEVVQLPDSAKASHILIPYIGALRADPNLNRVKDDAKILADSLLNVVKRNRGKFADLANEFSSDPGSNTKGGEYDWFTYNAMTPKFRDFVFEGKKGDIGIVETPFGFHVIKVDGHKNKQKAVKLATFARQILPSDETENIAFQQAETFALDLSNGKNMSDVAKEKSLSPRSAVNIKSLDENVVGLGNQRQIVQWAFNKDTEVGSYKRFDVEGGYVVAVLTGGGEKGMMSVDKATARVRPIVLNEKKAALIADKMNGSTLADIASENKQTVKTASEVTLQSPTLIGVGSEPNVVGAMSQAKENELYKGVNGAKGVFAFTVTKRELPTALPNYDSERNRMVSSRRNQSFRMYEAIKNAANIEDNRATYYGVGQ